jgi:hypothetical protein
MKKEREESRSYVRRKMRQGELSRVRCEWAMGMRITMGARRRHRHQKTIVDWLGMHEPARWELELELESLEAKERREKEKEMK